MRESGVQSTGAEIKKYLTVDDGQFPSMQHASIEGLEGFRHTIVDLLQSNLGILRQTLLGFVGQHECLGLLRRRHWTTVTRIHFQRRSEVVEVLKHFLD